MEVDGRTVIYDPQEPFSPKHFRSAAQPSRLAYVLNGTEAKRLGMNDDVQAAAIRIAADLPSGRRHREAWCSWCTGVGERTIYHCAGV